MNEEYYFLTFKSTHDVLKFEKEISKEGFKTTIMPVPRDISHSCGLALRLLGEDLISIGELAKDKDLKTDGLYKVNIHNKERTIQKLNEFNQ